MCKLVASSVNDSLFPHEKLDSLFGFRFEHDSEPWRTVADGEEEAM